MSARIRTVARTDEFERVCALASRPEPGTREAERQAERDNRDFTQLLITPEGRRAGVSLIGHQGYALREIFENRGGYLVMPVGAGKTLVFLLASYVLDSERPVQFVPASMLGDTFEAHYQYRKHWKTLSGRNAVRLMSYRDLSSKENLRLLDDIKPGFYGLDEGDKLSNQESAVTVRLARDIDEREVETVVGTATGGRWSLTDFSHFLCWTLKDGAPVPLDVNECKNWSLALDGKGNWKRKMLPGALHDLADVYEEDLELFDKLGIEISDVFYARLAFQRRLKMTPGVVIVDEDSCKLPLTIELCYAPEDARIDRVFQQYLETDRRPDDWELIFELEKFGFERQAGCGFHYYYKPPPPEPWCEARREWHKFVRHTIKKTRRYGNHPLDTEGAIKDALRDHQAVQEWVALEKTVPLNSKSAFFSDSVVRYVAAEARKLPMLVFCEFEEVGRRIAHAAGLRYFGAGGLDDNGASITRLNPSKSAILSLNANMRGRNLQAWHEAMVVGCPQSARDLEQLLGREHRYGQTKPVRYRILQTSGISDYAFAMAELEARIVLQRDGTTQKILRANIKRPKRPKFSPRWKLRSARA